MTNRRSFVLSAATAAGSGLAAGANDRIRLGIIGPGNRGQYLMRQLNTLTGLEWAAAADVYDVRRDAAQKVAGNNLTKLSDYRQVLDRKDVDAVVIATPDHWHAKMLIDAVGAGKDVFCEKPMVSNPSEGHRVVAAIQKSRRIVQIGTQQRSLPAITEAKKRFIDSGALGRVTMVHCQWNANPGSLMGNIPDTLQNKPEGLDWDAWQGSLPRTDWNPKKYFRPFCFWGPSAGPAGNLLIHYLDVVHWYLGLKAPSWALSMGGILHLKDGRDVPDTFTSSLEYPEGVIVSFDCSAVDQTRKEFTDLKFMGTKGRLHVFRQGFRFIPKENPSAEVTGPGQEGAQHVANWVDSVRSRRQPNSNAVDGHYLATSCYMATRAWFEKGPAYWNPSWDLAAGLNP